MKDDPTVDPAVSVFFELNIDNAELGAFSKCSGLGIEIENDTRTEGSLSDFVHVMTGRFKYTNLTLSRPICTSTKDVMLWISEFTMVQTGTTASLVALSTEGKPIVTWELYGVVPVRWTGPEFDSGNLQVATETLELAYTGFL